MQKRKYYLQLFLEHQRTSFLGLPGHGSGRNFISRKAVKLLKLKPTGHETCNILTVNGTKVQSMPIFDAHMKSLDRKSCEEVEFTESKLADFTTVRMPEMNQVKWKYQHTQDKRFYMTSTGEYQIHRILGDGIHSRIRTERVFKGKPGELLVEKTTFGWVVHGGDEYGSGSTCMYLRGVSDCEKVYSLDVLGVKDPSVKDQLDVLRNFKGSVVLVQFKEESTVILKSAKFPVHRWESNVKSLESESVPNPSKILGHTWNKDDDTL